MAYVDRLNRELIELGQTDAQAAENPRYRIALAEVQEMLELVRPTFRRDGGNIAPKSPIGASVVPQTPRLGDGDILPRTPARDADAEMEPRVPDSAGVPEPDRPARRGRDAPWTTAPESVDSLYVIGKWVRSFPADMSQDEKDAAVDYEVYYTLANLRRKVN
jgi:hypothetical protein